jgi:hypothetical protein
MTDFWVGHVIEPTHPHSIYESVQGFIDIYTGTVFTEIIILIFILVFTEIIILIIET